MGVGAIWADRRRGKILALAVEAGAARAKSTGRRIYDCARCPAHRRRSWRCAKPDAKGRTHYDGELGTTCPRGIVEGSRWAAWVLSAEAWDAKWGEMDLHTAQAVAYLRDKRAEMIESQRERD